MAAKMLQKGLGILQVTERNHRWYMIFLIRFCRLNLHKACFQLFQALPCQGSGTDVRDKLVPDATHRIIRRVQVIKPAPVLIRNEVPCEGFQHLKIVPYRNRVLAILQCRQDKLLTIFVQQPADGVVIRVHVARDEDFVFEDNVWYKMEHLFNFR